MGIISGIVIQKHQWRKHSGGDGWLVEMQLQFAVCAFLGRSIAVGSKRRCSNCITVDCSSKFEPTNTNGDKLLVPKESHSYVMICLRCCRARFVVCLFRFHFGCLNYEWQGSPMCASPSVPSQGDRIYPGLSIELPLPFPLSPCLT